MSKAGRPKKNSAGLPEWFDINKYKPACDLLAMGWYEQLVFRRRAFRACEDCLKDGDKNFTRLAKALKLLQDDPIITEKRIRETTTEVVDDETHHNHPVLGEYSFRSGHIVTDPVIGITVRPVEGSALTPLTVGNFYDIEPPGYDEKKGIVALTTVDKDGYCHIEEPALSWRGQPIIAIDPAINDEIILREMHEWLIKLRKAEKKPPLAFTKNSDFLKWYNSGVLPYLDLLLWENMGHDFRWSAFIGELSQILDKPVSSESAAMKSAQSYAKKLLDEQTLRTLAAQATRERPHDAKKSGKLYVR